MPTTKQPLPFSGAQGNISEKTLAIHHDKLYAGYADKKDEIAEKLKALSHGGDVSSANQTYSELRGLKEGETFAINGVYLHEWYFGNLGGDGKPTGKIAKDLETKYGTMDNFLKYFAACGMAARGWVVLAWDTHDKALRIYNSDAHNQGGVWGALPLLIMDVYEHAYFIDYGSDRKAYIQEFLNHVNWQAVEERYDKALAVAL
ncbi:MAG: superoxide dismutase [Patescibacteria group bacterium]|jgi:Fe-Mn family superoxide dismutase|nr:superoxide dismutase [Patescibacteria group bacterium]